MAKSKPAQGYVMYDSEEAERTLNPKFMTPFLIQAQTAEFAKLKEVIDEVYQRYQRPLTIFDIGIGYARVPVLLRKNVDTWNKISRYVGIDNSQRCVDRSKKIIQSEKIIDKVEVVKFDALQLGNAHSEPFTMIRHDLVICTYFTAGDFKPDKIKLQTDTNGNITDYDINLLNPNQNFVAVFEGAYDLLSDGGKIVIGSVYLDNEDTRKRQEQFYENCGMTVITSKKDPFTATKEGFWSERFSQKKIYKYLSWIPPSKIEIVPLDDHDFAIMVIVNK
jgi:SAM-dependent methyltransferase